MLAYDTKISADWFEGKKNRNTALVITKGPLIVGLLYKCLNYYNKCIQ